MRVGMALAQLHGGLHRDLWVRLLAHNVGRHNSSLLWLGLARTTRSSHRAAARTDGAENEGLMAICVHARGMHHNVGSRLRGVCDDVVSVHASYKGFGCCMARATGGSWHQGMR